MTSFWQDVRYSLRMIAKAPGYAAIAILTLALGIGANTTIFSWINSALLNPVPGLSNPNEVVSLTVGSPGNPPWVFHIPTSKPCATDSRVLRALPRAVRSHEPDRQRQAGTHLGHGRVGELFRCAGSAARPGRGFLPAEDEKPGGAPVAVISDRLWQTHFGANPDIVGQTHRTQPAPLHDRGCSAAAVSGQPDRAAHGDLGPDHDGGAIHAQRRPAS